MIFRRLASLFTGFRAGGVILNLSHCDIKFSSRSVPRELHEPIKNNKNGGSEREGESSLTLFLKWFQKQKGVVVFRVMSNE